MTDIGELTYRQREGAKEVFNRQSELGAAELQDIVEAVARLTSILQRADNERAAA